MSNFIVERLSANELFLATWEFWFYADEYALVLDSYAERERRTRRHGWRILSRPSRAYARRRNPGWDLAEQAVPMPEDVVTEALSALVAKLRVCKWSARKAGLTDAPPLR